MVLKGTYGEKIHHAFRMTRQGVRWRFWRLFNDMYVSAFETILFIERVFGRSFATTPCGSAVSATRCGRRSRMLDSQTRPRLGQSNDGVERGREPQGSNAARR
jgi:hypothetical protein